MKLGVRYWNNTFMEFYISSSVPELKCLTDKDLLKIADILQEVSG